MDYIRPFYVVRNYDTSGVSGTGRVLDGAVFPDGTTVIRWRVPYMPNCTAIFDSYSAFKRIHIESHPDNKTEVHWYSGELEEKIDDEFSARLMCGNL